MPDDVSERAARIARAGKPTHHRLVGATLKTALAAGIAWQIAVMLPAYLPHYAFYAPLGALTVMYSAVHDSVTEGLRAVSAVMLGVLVSVGLHIVAGPSAITVAVALGVGTVLGSLRRLGDQGSWVPIAALFVFTAGRASTQYVVGYVSQLALGALIGLAVNALVFPPLALNDVERGTQRVRRDIVGVLDAMVALIAEGPEPPNDRVDAVRRTLARLPDGRQQLRQAMSLAERAQQANPRRGRWQESRADVMGLAGAVETIVSLVEDLAREMLEEQETLGRLAGARLVGAVSAVRDVFAHAHGGVADSELVRRAHDSLQEAAPADAPFVVQRVVAGLGRCLRIETGWIG